MPYYNFSQFHPSKCNFSKQSLDTSKPCAYRKRFLKFSISGQNPQKWEPWIKLPANAAITKLFR